MTATQSQTPTLGQVAGLVPSWLRSLRAENKSPRTLQSYAEAAGQFASFVADRGMPTAASSIRREHVEAFLERLLEIHSASTAANRSRSLQQYFRWLEDEGEITSSPMAKMRPPKQA